MDPWESKWRKGKGLGSGGQGETFLVTSVEEPARHGVLKLGTRPSSKARARMLNEVGQLNLLHQAGLKFPGVLDAGSLTDFIDDKEQTLWFVMDFIAGRTLDKHLQHAGAFTFDQAVATAWDLAGTIGLAHKMGVLHRDLKPANLMVRGTEPPDVAVLDCGLAFNERDIEGDLTGEEPIRNKFLSLSEGNTPGGNRRDPRSDLTAISALLLYCLTRQNIGFLFDENGLPPHRRPGCTMQELLAGDPRRRQAELFFDRAFAIDINKRFQSPDELILRLATLTDKPPIAFREPFEVANTRAAELRDRHRRTQLAVHGARFEKTIVPDIKVWLQNTVPHFPHPFGGGQMSLHDISKPLPDGMETMWFEGNTQSILFAVTVGYYGHPNHWLFAARTAVRGTDGVLLGLTTRVTNTPDLSPPWEELMVFSPTELPASGEFIDRFKEGLSRAIDLLSDDVERN